MAMQGSSVRQAIVMEAMTDGQGHCWPGDAMGPLTLSADLLLVPDGQGLMALRAVSNLLVPEWYWGQCRVQGLGFIGSLVATAGLGALFLCALGAWLYSTFIQKRDVVIIAEGRLIAPRALVAGVSMISGTPAGALAASTHAIDAAPGQIVVGRAIPALL